MQVDTKIVKGTYYERSTARHAENGGHFSLEAYYTDTGTDSRLNEGRDNAASYPASRIYPGTKVKEQIERQLAGTKEGTDAVKGADFYRSGEKAPYDYLAEDGMINYKGVIFLCDTKNNRLTLGDVSNPNHCLRVSLKGGGSLMVNYDNLDDLAKAITMFSPEDQARIMRAITVYKMSKHAQKEIEDIKAGDEESDSEEEKEKETTNKI